MQMSERNRRIIEMREAGTTYRAIAREFGISIERARQIYITHTRRKQAIDADGFFAQLDRAAKKCGYGTPMAVRTFHCLTWSGIQSTEHLKYWTDDELLKIRNFGVKTLEIARTAQKAVG